MQNEYSFAKSASIQSRTNPDKFSLWLRFVSPDLGFVSVTVANANTGFCLGLYKMAFKKRMFPSEVSSQYAMK